MNLSLYFLKQKGEVTQSECHVELNTLLFQLLHHCQAGERQNVSGMWVSLTVLDTSGLLGHTSASSFLTPTVWDVKNTRHYAFLHVFLLVVLFFPCTMPALLKTPANNPVINLYVCTIAPCWHATGPANAYGSLPVGLLIKLFWNNASPCDSVW